MFCVKNLSGWPLGVDDEFTYAFLLAVGGGFAGDCARLDPSAEPGELSMMSSENILGAGRIDERKILVQVHEDRSEKQLQRVTGAERWPSITARTPLENRGENASEKPNWKREDL